MNCNIDVMVLRETWLKVYGDDSKVASMTPPDYKLTHQPRLTHGGGQTFISRENLWLSFDKTILLWKNPIPFQVT